MNKKRYILVSIHLIIIAFINIYSIYWQDLSKYGMFYLLYSGFTFVCLVKIQKNLITPINILYGTFVLFQAGVPIAFFIKEDYTNFYVSLFTSEIILNAAKYTLWSIEAFSFALIIFLKPSNKCKVNNFANISALNSSTHVYFIARVIFVITAMVVVPLYAYSAILSLQFGFSQEIRSIVATSSFFNLMRALFCPSFFLLVCYNKQHIFTKLSTYIFILACILALVSANRTDGILWLLTYFYYNYMSKKKSFSNTILIYIGVLTIVFVAVYIGQNRLGRVSMSFESTIIGLIEEMGFNFFSICFVMLYIPSEKGFLLGASYIDSLICMIPKSLDVFHLFDSMRRSLPPNWIYDMNHVKFNGLLDFGTGFSMIGESYMNFSWAGFIISFLYAFILCKIFGGNWYCDTKWKKYLQMTIFMALLTFPRRGFIEFLNVIFYSVIFIAIIIFITYKKRKSCC